MIMQAAVTETYLFIHLLYSQEVLRLIVFVISFVRSLAFGDWPEVSQPHGHRRASTGCALGQWSSVIVVRTAMTAAWRRFRPTSTFCSLCTGWAKKVRLHCLHVTSSNTGRFSKFFHCHIMLQEICNEAIIKYSTSPQTCRYTTLWNIYVRKLVSEICHIISFHKIKI